mgnify:CR=1 FL=1
MRTNAVGTIHQTHLGVGFGDHRMLTTVRTPLGFLLRTPRVQTMAEKKAKYARKVATDLSKCMR